MNNEGGVIVFVSWMTVSYQYQWVIVGVSRMTSCKPGLSHGFTTIKTVTKSQRSLEVRSVLMPQKSKRPRCSFALLRLLLRIIILQVLLLLSLVVGLFPLVEMSSYGFFQETRFRANGESRSRSRDAEIPLSRTELCLVSFSCLFLSPFLFLLPLSLYTLYTLSPTHPIQSTRPCNKFNPSWIRRNIPV